MQESKQERGKERTKVLKNKKGKTIETLKGKETN